MKRPKLNEVDILEIAFEPGVILTMRPNQWDNFLAAGYENGSLLLEVKNETPIRAFQKIMEDQDDASEL